MLGIGTLVGVCAAAGAYTLLKSMLFGLESWDPTVYILSCSLLWGIALLAVFVPTRRATCVDPNIALRYE
jgi:hypothetical protein